MTLKVFLKYIIKSMTEKKGRFLLLIFSIAISTALFVFSLGAVDVILLGLEDTIRNISDGNDISISSNTADIFFSEKDFEASGLTDFEGELYTVGIINKDDEITYVGLSGKKDCSKYIQEGSMPENSSEAICAISDRTAKEHGLELGDKLEVAVSGEKISFTVNAICVPNGTYYSDAKDSFVMTVPYNYMETIMNSGGRYNNMTAKTLEKDAVKAAEKFNEVNERVKATCITDLSAEREMTESTVTSFYMMFAIVCIICCIIIHGAFKLIINERMTVIGTFMSQGATRKKIEKILLLESILYSVFGAIIGVALGELILYIVSRESSPFKDYGIYMNFDIDPKLIITGAVFAVLMSVVSAYLPARSVRKLPVKDVILNRLEVQHKKSAVTFIIGTALLIFAIMGAFIDAEWTNNLSIIFTAAAFIGMIMLLRRFLKIVAGLLAKLFRKNTILFLAANNIKTSKLLRGNITLLVISFTAVLIIASVGKSMTSLVVDGYEKLNFDYQVNNIFDSNTDKTTTDIITEKLNELDCIDKKTIMPVHSTMGLVGKVNVIIQGVEPLKYAEYNEYLELESDKYYKYIKALDESIENSVIISDYIAEETDKKIGDNIEIEINNKTVSFKVVGSYDGKLLNGGMMIIMKPEVLKKEFNIREASGIVFNIIGDAEAAEKEFKGFLADLGATYISNSDMMEENKMANNQIVYLLGAFAVIALIVASIGIFNNITISFQQRRKEFAVMSSVGMNAKKRKMLVFAENMCCVVFGIAISIPFTLLANKLVSKVLATMNLPLDLEFDWNSVPMYSAILVVIIFIASLSTMKKSKKINVVQELKYE